MPEYTYRCPQGHEWDEYRSLSEDSSISATPCETCVQAINPAIDLGIPANGPDPTGRKIVPTGVTARFIGRGWTPKFYRNRTGK